MFLIRWILNLVRILNSNKGTGEVAGGIAFGLWLALIPAGNLLWIGLLLFTFFLKINFGAELLFMAIFKFIVPLVDPLLDRLGLLVLGWEPLAGFFTRIYNLPIFPFTRFNNSLVMGGLLAGVVLWAPCFLIFRSLVKLYRERVRDRLANSKLIKVIAKLPLVSGLIRLVSRAGKLYAEVR